MTDYKREFKDKMPDTTDRHNIVNIIKLYDTAYPYPHPFSIGKSIESAIGEMDNKLITSTNHSTGHRSLKGDAGNIRRLSLPLPFLNLLKKSYPTIITNNSHYAWFLDNFPALDLLQYDAHEKYQGLAGKK